MASLVAHQEPPDVSQPSEGPFHLPTLRVAWSGFPGRPSLGCFLARRSNNGIVGLIPSERNHCLRRLLS